LRASLKHGGLVTAPKMRVKSAKKDGEE